MNTIIRHMKMIKKARRWGFNQMFHQLAYLGELSPYILDARKKIDVIRNISYYNSSLKANLLDIYVPKTKSRLFPIMLYIHGGGFSICSKDTHRGVALLYARLGFLVFNINYRLAPKNRYPAAFEDVCHAYQWILKNAADYGGDTNRLVVAGESAGGNLALGLTAATCYLRPETYAQKVWETGIIPAATQIIAGILQVSNPKRFISLPQYKSSITGDYSAQIIRDISIGYLGRKQCNFQDDLTFADPLAFIENMPQSDRPLPPIFAGVGTSDILCNDTERLEKVLKTRSIDIEAHYYENEPHIFHLMSWRPNTHKFWQDTRTFLKPILKAH